MSRQSIRTISLEQRYNDILSKQTVSRNTPDELRFQMKQALKERLYSQYARQFAQQLKQKNLYNNKFIKGLMCMSDYALVKGLDDKTFAGMCFKVLSDDGVNGLLSGGDLDVDGLVDIFDDVVESVVSDEVKDEGEDGDRELTLSEITLDAVNKRKQSSNDIESNDTSTDTGSTETPQPISQVTDYKIQDTFASYSTNSLLYGKNLTPYVKNILLALLEHFVSNHTIYMSSSSPNYDTKLKIHKLFKQHLSAPSTTLSSIKQAFQSQSIECFLAYALLAYQSGKNDLMLRTMYTFGRVLPLTSKTEWFDNYRLNAYGNVLNTVMREQSITEDIRKSNNVYTIAHDIEPINKSVKIKASRMCSFLVGSLREFIIKNGLLATTDLCSKELTIQELKSYIDEHKEPNLSAQDICDIAYQHYPFFYGGAHGCDCFSIDLAPTIDEIAQFLNRYPSAKVGFILNTATYKSGRGQHWVALMLSKGKSQLICSQKGDYDNFADGGALVSALRRNGFDMSHNSTQIQYDSHSCGMQSAMALMQLLKHNSITSTVESIGVDMSELTKDARVGGEKGTSLVIEKIAGTSQNT